MAAGWERRGHKKLAKMAFLNRRRDSLVDISTQEKIIIFGR